MAQRIIIAHLLKGKGLQHLKIYCLFRHEYILRSSRLPAGVRYGWLASNFTQVC
jgi:hypothetical protein